MLAWATLQPLRSTTPVAIRDYNDEVDDHGMAVDDAHICWATILDVATARARKVMDDDRCFLVGGRSAADKATDQAIMLWDQPQRINLGMTVTFENSKVKLSLAAIGSSNGNLVSGLEELVNPLALADDAEGLGRVFGEGFAWLGGVEGRRLEHGSGARGAGRGARGAEVAGVFEVRGFGGDSARRTRGRTLRGFTGAGCRWLACERHAARAYRVEIVAFAARPRSAIAKATQAAVDMRGIAGQQCAGNVPMLLPLPRFNERHASRSQSAWQ